MNTAPTSRITIANGILEREGSRVHYRDFTPPRLVDERPILWVHGGGFASGSLNMPESAAVAEDLARRTGRFVRATTYRKVGLLGVLGAPRLRPHRNRFPAAVNDIGAVVKDLEDRGPTDIGGASAGACLAATVALRRRDRGRLGALGRLFLVYGTFHSALPHVPAELTAATKAAGGILFTPESTRRMNANYVGDSTVDGDARAFPGGTNLQGLPPTLLINADHDTLRTSGEQFAEELRHAGVEVTCTTIPETTHGFLNKPQRPGFADALAVIERWFERTDSSSSAQPD